MKKFISAVFLALFCLGAAPVFADVVLVVPGPHPIYHHRHHWHHRHHYHHGPVLVIP